MRAPELPVPFVTATALPLMSALDFCLFTTIWDDPKEFEAGRFAVDISTSSSAISQSQSNYLISERRMIRIPVTEIAILNQKLLRAPC